MQGEYWSHLLDPKRYFTLCMDASAPQPTSCSRILLQPPTKSTDQQQAAAAIQKDRAAKPSRVWSQDCEVIIYTLEITIPPLLLLSHLSRSLYLPLPSPINFTIWSPLQYTTIANDMEPFTLIEEPTGSGPHHLFDDVLDLNSAKTADHDFQYVAALRRANPGTIVTTIPGTNISLPNFAAAGFADCELDTETDSFSSLRGYAPPFSRQQKGRLAESIGFAKYHYRWNREDFILYWVRNPVPMQYLLKERQGGENVYGPSAATDALIKAAGDWSISDEQIVYVFDLFWTKSKELWQQVQKASWDKVILDESLKQELTQVANKFFSSKAIYEDLGVPWKRGLMFHGPPGNGKTISIKALMHTLLDRKHSIPTLYVKSAPLTYHIRAVFQEARRQAPCMLIFEDIETIVTAQTRSYFFNEMDGLEGNSGLFIVASTNYLDRLDPGLTKRPSRFDRKYLFPLPNEHERTLYCEFWRHKLTDNKKIVFPAKLSPAMAHVTPGFSFAFMQECFVATLLVLAREETSDVSHFSDDDLDDYELWREFKKEADILRKEVEGTQGQTPVEYHRGDGQAIPGVIPPPTMTSHALQAHKSASDSCSFYETAISTFPDPDSQLYDGGSQTEDLAALPQQKRIYISSAAREYRM